MADSKVGAKRFLSRALISTLIMGALSVGLYFVLYLYSGALPDLAAQTRQGNKLYALIPLVIALVFSFVHGSFTGRFWDLLGLRAKN